MPYRKMVLVEHCDNLETGEQYWLVEVDHMATAKFHKGPGGESIGTTQVMLPIVARCPDELARQIIAAQHEEETELVKRHGLPWEKENGRHYCNYGGKELLKTAQLDWHPVAGKVGQIWGVLSWPPPRRVKAG